MLWKNPWFQLGTVVVIVCGGLLIYDFGPGVYSSLMTAKSAPAQQAPAPSTPSNPTPAPPPPQPVATDDAEAAGYRIKATAGDVEAARKLGMLYYKGDGVPQDFTEAFKWLKIAAEHGDEDSQEAVGMMYSGLGGVTKDKDQALVWFQKAAAQGNFSWLQKSANQGNPIAQWYLGCMYERGLGTTKDIPAALEWDKKAAQQGITGAQNDLIRLKSSTTPASPATPAQPASGPPVQNSPAPTPAAARPVAGQAWTNSLGMKFVPAGTDGVLFCTEDVRVKDFQAYAQATGYQQTGGIYVIKVKTDANGTRSLASELDPNASWEHPGFEQGPSHPVVGVSWNEAIGFCDWLTKKEQDEGKLDSHQMYRLPTDAEWSTAVGTTKYPWGDVWPPPRNAGNYGDQAFAPNLPGMMVSGWNATCAPKGFRANAYGLYDMGGNVWQWCMDSYQTSMNSAEVRQKIPSVNDDGGGSKYRVLRGDSWSNFDPEYLLSSFRNRDIPDVRRNDYGVRVVVVVSPPPAAPAAPAYTPPTPTPTPVQPASTPPTSTPASTPPPATASQPVAGQPWTNSLGMKFVPAGTDGVLFCIWDVRVQDFQAYAQATGYQQTGGIAVIKIRNGDGAEGDSTPDGSQTIFYHLDPNASWENPGFEQGPTYPVVGVSWNEAISFCEWLTKKERADGKLGMNQMYRLPTSAEWSTAVDSGKYPWGDVWPPPDGAGNYRDQAFASSLPGTGWSSVCLPENDGYPRTSPVGSFPANGYGLYDMGGNVLQWCMDWYQTSMNSDEVRKEFVPARVNFGLNTVKVLRGSSWQSSWGHDALRANFLSSFCFPAAPDQPSDFIGFRVVVVVSPSSPVPSTPIPAPPSSPTTSAPTVPTSNPSPPSIVKGYYHSIQSGETLSSIAEWYRQKGVEVTVEDIRKANGLSDQTELKVGQALFIPKPQ